MPRHTQGYSIGIDINGTAAVEGTRAQLKEYACILPHVV